MGWLFAMSQNPLVGFSIFSGPIGVSDDDGAALRLGAVGEGQLPARS